MRIPATLLLLALIGCEREEINRLTVSPAQIAIPAEGGHAVFTIATDAASWEIHNPASSWVQLSARSGAEKEIAITLHVSSRTLLSRSDTLTIRAGNAKPERLVVTQASSEYLYTIGADTSELTFARGGGSASIQITTDAPEWTLQPNADWVQASRGSGGKGITTITVTALENTEVARTARLTISADQALPIEIWINQSGDFFPDYNTSPIPPDATGMNSTATELAARMRMGWNIGNTLEAIGGETAWGNPMVTGELIQLVRQHGFNVIRIPCSWFQHQEDVTTARIRRSWLDRVRQVVQHCIDHDMYVMLNIHWDGGWLENHVTPERRDEVNARQRAFWQQIATHLRDFDERLMFASANEPNVDNAAQMEVLLSYHQTFVDAVRSTGGRNHYRVLIIPGPKTDVELAYQLMHTLPTDVVPNRLMVQIHYYTPFQFTLMTEDASWGRMFYFWGRGYHSPTLTDRNATWGEEEKLDELLGKMRTKFVDAGIPVIMGEYTAIRRLSPFEGDSLNLNLHLRSRLHFLRYFTRQARSHGMIPVYWDAGNMGNNSSALFNRRSYTVYDQPALDALMEGANLTGGK